VGREVDQESKTDEMQEKWRIPASGRRDMARARCCCMEHHAVPAARAAGDCRVLASNAQRMLNTAELTHQIMTRIGDGTAAGHGHGHETRKKKVACRLRSPNSRRQRDPCLPSFLDGPTAHRTTELLGRRLEKKGAER
jgi:hypothetical protein